MRWMWRAIIAAWGGAAAAAAAIDVDEPLRLLLVSTFVLVCPGLAIVRLLRFQSAAVNMWLGVAVSASIAGIVSAGSIYLGRWSPDGALAVLITITGTAIVGDVLIGDE